MASGLSVSQVLMQRSARDYEEQPGLRLTPQQARRLWDLDGATCGAVLTALVDAGGLQPSADGRFGRRLRTGGGRRGSAVPGAPGRAMRKTRFVEFGAWATLEWFWGRQGRAVFV